MLFIVSLRSMTIMLVVVSSYSLVTTVPRMIAVAMNPLNHGSAFNMHHYYFFLWAIKIISPWNYSGNFFFYVLSGKQFRDELVLMFCCRERASGTSVYNMFRH